MFTVLKGCRVVDPGSQSEEIFKRGERVKGVNWRPSERLVYWRELRPGIKRDRALITVDGYGVPFCFSHLNTTYLQDIYTTFGMN